MGRLLSLFATVALLCQATSSLAQEPPTEPPAPATDPRAQAKALTDEGLELVRSSDMPAALERFRRAYALFPDPNLLVNIGSALRFLGRPAEAETMYRQYVRHPGARAEIKSELLRNLDELDALLGTLRIRSTERGIRVRLDGTLRPEAGTGIDVVRVAAGEHTLTAEFEGKAAVVQTLEVEARKTVEVALHPTEAEIEIVRPSPLPYVGIAVGAAGLATLGIGTTFGVLALLTNDEVAKRCDDAVVCDAEGVRLEDEARTQATIATVGFAVGGSALVAGIVMLAIPTDSSREKSSAGWTVDILPFGLAGVSLRSAW